MGQYFWVPNPHDSPIMKLLSYLVQISGMRWVAAYHYNANVLILLEKEMSTCNGSTNQQKPKSVFCFFCFCFLLLNISKLICFIIIIPLIKLM
ncbi:unnamed protein product, partial [Larinioides sclopetarius]